MPQGTTWCRVLSVAFAVIAIWRLWEAFGMAVIASSAPFVGFLALVCQGLAALIATIALWNERPALGRVSLAAFVVFVVVQMAADTFGYGIRSLVEALAAVLLALVMAGLGWLALETRGPRARGPSPIGSEI